ncbi:MAG: hypothetical protein RL514_911 [Verrucomicrobiota bacterium]|jgi:exosortase
MNLGSLIPAGVVLALVWLQLFNQLRSDWAINPQYAFGFAVPPLALALLWRRWHLRPAPAPGGWNALAWLSGAPLLLLPIRLIEEANPEWRLVLWGHALLLTGFTLALLQHAGGTAWRRHFALPILFLLVSVPWPMMLEQAVIQNLMRGVAMVTVELAGLADISALRHGNLIEISAGLVGVDEACSGVRSVQTTLMVSLFLGELYAFNAWRRGALVAAGILVALPANVGRTFFLVWVAARQGFEAMHRAHDGAGMVVISLVLPVLWGVALLLRRGWKPGLVRPPAVGVSPQILNWKLSAVLVGLVVFAEAGTEAWYRAHEGGAVANARWAIAWPTNQNGFGELEISDTARATLRCDVGRGVSWTDARASQWQMFFLRWEPGKNSAQLAKGHTPDICLPGTGHKLRAEHERLRIAIHGLDLTFRHYEFASGARTLFVFYCLWEDRQATPGSDAGEDGTQRSRLEAVRAGRRNLGQQVLELAVDGPVTPEESIAALREQLGLLIAREAHATRVPK